MNTIEGRLQTILRVETFTLKLDEDVYLHNLYHFDIEVVYELYKEIYSKDWEEPSEPAWIELYSVKVLDRAYLSDERGLMLSIQPSAKLLEIIDQEQYLKICDALMLKNERVKL